MGSEKSRTREKICLDTVVVHIVGLPSAYIGDVVAFMSIKNSKYYGLDSVGTRIWALIEKPKRINEVVDEVLKEYNVERTICEDNVLELMGKLLQEDLIYTVQET